MKTTTNGLVIWESRTGEADRVITLMTPTGVITAYAKGSLRPRGRLTSSTAMLTLSDFELFTGRNMYTVDDAQVRRRFLRLTTDPVSYALAVYFCELLKLLAPVEDDASGFLSLMLNSLYLLDEQKKPLALVKAVFELRVMSLAGYMPDLSGCVSCGADGRDGAHFNVAEGTMLCPRCAAASGVRINVPGSVVQAMRYVTTSTAAKAFSFTLEKHMDPLCELAERYLLTRLERPVSTLQFYTSVAT